MNYVRRTHVGGDYAKVEVYDEHGNVEEYEIGKHVADAINNMQPKFSELELRAIRSAITWAEMLEKSGEVEIFDYQREAFDKLKSL